jgi:homoserine dehydrogenase
MTKMSEEGLPFDEALAAAQRLGFAEADPTLDISGGDASHKIAILASLAFNTPVDHAAVHCEGISGIDQADIAYAADLGYVVRLIAIARDRGAEGFEARVHPMLVPLHDQLAGIRNEFNAVFVRSDYMGDGMFTGRGAGSFPTASAVIADIVDIAGRIRDGLAAVPVATNWRPRPLLPFADSENRCYLRFTTLDQPGILSRISGILGEHGISIASVKQAESVDPDAVPLVMVTHHARERDLRRAITEIDALEIIRRPTVIIRAL